MSGPWDRPSSDDPDAQWPSEDLRQASDRDAARDPATEGAPGWDDWPPAPPPSDEYVVDEPLPPSSDPWAESWTEEEADAMLRSASTEPPPAADQWVPPRAAEVEPHPEPVWREPDGEPSPAEHRVEADATPEVDTGPRVEPWSPDPDPWRFETELQPEAEPVAAPPPPEPDAVAGAEPAPPDPPPTPVARWPVARDELPDWLADPLPADAPPDQPEISALRAGDAAPGPDPADAPQPAVTDSQPEGEAGAGVEAQIETEPLPEDAEQTELEPHTELEPQPDAVVESRPEEESGSFWSSILPWRSGSRIDPEPARSDEAPVVEEVAASADEPPAVTPAVPGAETEHPWIEADDADAEREAATAQGEPEPDGAPEPAIEPRWPASVPEREWGEDTAAESNEASADEAPDFVPIGGGLTYAEPAADLEPELEPEREPQPELEAVDAPAPPPFVEPPPEPRSDAWADSGWDEAGDSTRVLPSDWAATRPESRTELEPSAGSIRTRLTEPDADLDEDAAPTIAEQAVPWLIGVILLLAGMVIVLLALIFAGDGSLGGGAPSQRPSPTLAAVLPVASASATPSQTAVSTASPAPSGTPEPTPAPEPGPEYGPLEMVFQGRSAALAPIYLLRRDFTLEEDPTVLAQDADFDVRRFAWTPDGTGGAGLLADVLVSIEPGEEKRRLGDGLETITFGDDGSTIYAVRITEDGADDAAAVLAIDYVSGDTEEIASVTYARPELGDEPALGEAAFSDDGGAVRLFWMHDDALRLWVLGAGAWTIDPEGGDVTELDGEPLPTLVAPNGRDRIGLEEADGVTTLTVIDMNDRPRASTTVEGLVSHLRWSPAGDRVVFTVGRSAAGGGVLQDLFLWDLEDGEAPAQLTTSGAAFGAEWLGTQPRWRE